MELRDYQKTDLERIREAIRKGSRRVVYKLATGGGKTLMATFFAKRVAENKKTLFFIVHRRELMIQASETFCKFGITHGRIAPGFAETDDLIQVASIHALNARIKRGKVYKPDVIFFDEGHHAAASMWQRCYENISTPKTILIGLTATPWRLDSRGLDKMFDTLILGPETKELIARGYLCKFEHFAPPSTLDLSDIKTVNGDYDQVALRDIVDEPKIIGDAVRHYKQMAAGKQAVYFCVSIKHSQHTVEAFRAAGINAVHIDGKDAANRIKAVAMFARNGIQVLTNCDIVSEGFDLPAIEVVGMLRPTKSLVLYLQQAGRALRPDPENPGKVARIIDHVGNIHNFGMIDEVRTWSLKGKQKRQSGPRVAPIKECPECYMAVSIACTCCPGCGFIYVTAGDIPDFEEGNLEQVDAAKINKAMEMKRRMIEVSRAGSYEELVAIGKSRGYHKNWAKIRWEIKNGRR